MIGQPRQYPFNSSKNSSKSLAESNQTMAYLLNMNGQSLNQYFAMFLQVWSGLFRLLESQNPLLVGSNNQTRPSLLYI